MSMAAEDVLEIVIEERVETAYHTQNIATVASIRNNE